MWKIIGLLLLISLASLAKFENSFVWDDIPLLVQSDLLYHWENLPVLFGHDTMYAADGGKFAQQAQLDTFRPITLSTFMLDAWISGRSPFAFHLSNLLYHLLATLLLWLLIRRFWRPDLAWLPAAFFGLNPLLTEAHFWINGRSDLLCALFGFAALLLVEEGQGKRRGVWLLSGLAFLLGLLSKEVLLLLLPAWLLWRLGFFHERLSELKLAKLKSALLDLSPAILASIIYLIWRSFALSGLKASGGLDHLLMAALRTPFLIFDGLYHILLPVDTSLRYLMEEYGRLSTALFLLAWLALLLLALLIFVKRRRLPLLSFGLLCFVLILSPAALITGLKWYGFGRYLYLPSALLFMGLAEGLEAVQRAQPNLKPLLRFILPLLLAVEGLILALSSSQWDGDEAMYRDIIESQPENSHGFGGLGRLLIQRGEYPAAAQMLMKAVAHNPGDARHLHNLSQALYRGGQAPRAFAVAQEGIKRFPKKARFYHTAALLLMNRDLERTLHLLLRAMAVEPSYSKASALLKELLERHPQAERYRQLLEALQEEDSASPSDHYSPPVDPP